MLVSELGPNSICLPSTTSSSHPVKGPRIGKRLRDGKTAWRRQISEEITKKNNKDQGSKSEERDQPSVPLPRSTAKKPVRPRVCCFPAALSCPRETGRAIQSTEVALLQPSFSQTPQNGFTCGWHIWYRFILVDQLFNDQLVDHWYKMLKSTDLKFFPMWDPCYSIKRR